jgi:ribosomal protein S18 acetylase RimI-like enzyme
MNASIFIRPATPADATHLACIVDMASEGLAEKVWATLKQPGQTLFEVGRGRALRTEGAFSYTNGHIAEVDGVVAAGMVCYRIPEAYDPNYRMAGTETPTPAFIAPVIELERLAPGAWYVNIIAVYPEYRGRRLAEQLLAHADRLAKQASADTVALVVDADNASARKLYERCGYRERARRPLVPFPARPDGGEWLLMTKPVA